MLLVRRIRMRLVESPLSHTHFLLKGRGLRTPSLCLPRTREKSRICRPDARSFNNGLLCVFVSGFPLLQWFWRFTPTLPECPGNWSRTRVCASLYTEALTSAHLGRSSCVVSVLVQKIKNIFIVVLFVDRRMPRPMNESLCVSHLRHLVLGNRAGFFAR